MLIHPVAKFGIITDWCKIAVFFAAAMMTYGRNGIGRTIGASPYDIGPAEFFKDFFDRDIQYVSIEVDIFKSFIPLNTENFMSMFLECFTDTARSGK